LVFRIVGSGFFWIWTFGCFQDKDFECWIWILLDFSGSGFFGLDLDFFGFSGSGSVLLDLDSVSFFRILASIVIQRCSFVLLLFLFLEHLLFFFDVWFFFQDVWISVFSSGYGLLIDLIQMYSAGACHGRALMPDFVRSRADGGFVNLRVKRFVSFM
jgi:hypothetical protein